MGYDTQGYGIDEDSNVGLHAYNDDGSLQRFSDVSNAMKKKTTNTGYGLMPSSNRVGPVVAPIAPDLYSTISQRGGSYNPKTGQYSVGRDSGQTAAESISSDYNAIEPDTMTSTDPAGNPFGMQPHAYPPGLSITEARGPNAGQDFDLRPSGGEQQDYNSYDTILQDNPAHGQWMQDKQGALNALHPAPSGQSPSERAEGRAGVQNRFDASMDAKVKKQEDDYVVKNALRTMGGTTPDELRQEFRAARAGGAADTPTSGPVAKGNPFQPKPAPATPTDGPQITDFPTASPKPTGKKTVKLMGKTYQVSPQDFDQISAANKSGDQTTVQRIIQNYSGQ